jgi:hypothetical protein
VRKKGKRKGKKGKSKGKDASTARSVDEEGGKGASKSAKPVDGEEKLSDETREWHQLLVDSVPQESVDNGTWKDAILHHIELEGTDGSVFFEHVFGHLQDLGKLKNKRIYIGPGRDGSSDDKISIDCKFDSQNTKVTYSKIWAQEGFVKTTYAYVDRDLPWELIEDEVGLDSSTAISAKKLAILIHPPTHGGGSGIPAGHTALVAVDPDFDYEELGCFYCGEDTSNSPCTTCGQDLCPECTTTVGCTCLLAPEDEGAVDSFVPKLGQDKITTFNKRQRRIVKTGAKAVTDQDEAMWSALARKPTGISPLKKCLLAVTLLSNGFVNAIGQMTSFADPGSQGKNCDDNMIRSLNQTVEDQDPSLIYIHVPFAKDEFKSREYDRLKTFAEDQMKAGKTCVIADTRHTDRWTGVSPTLCKGDLAFYCNHTEIIGELVSWAKARDNGNPRCTDDLEEPEFADVLAGLAEAHHMDKCVDAAFVGTEEAAAEPKTPGIDGIFGPEDLGKEDPADVHDDEQDLLERIPLPGNPQSEQQRKKIWLSLPRRARIAIRRLHRNFKHLPKNALVQMLRAAKVPKDYIDAAKSHRCDVCEATRKPSRTNKVARPKPYIFNHEVGVDVLEIKDAAGTFYDILNVVDYGTTFEQAFIVREADTNGVPSSASCLDAFVKRLGPTVRLAKVRRS